MKCSLTQKLSNEELWKSWDPTPFRIKSGLAYSVLTPMGYGIVHQDGEAGRWVVKPGWDVSQYHAENEEQAIYLLVESYLQAEKRVVESFVLGLKVNLGMVDKHGYVCNYVGGYTIRKGVELVDPPRGRESTEGGQKQEVYILSYMGNVLEKNTTPHVWEDQITSIYQHEVLKSLNLR